MSDSGGSLVQEARRARSEHRLDDARALLVQAVAMSRSAGKPAPLIVALKALGQIERDLGRGDAALVCYEEAVTIGRAGGDLVTLAHTIRHVGDIHLDAGRLEPAERSYHEALRIYRKQESTPPTDLANALRSFAILKERNGSPDVARRLWTEARELYAAAGVRDGVVESESRLARLDT